MYRKSYLGGQLSKKRHRTHKKDKISRKSQINILALQYGLRCWYCGISLKRDKFVRIIGVTAPIWGRGLHIDHVLPKTLGGDDHLRNKALACEFCNRAKSGHPVDSFLRWINWVRNHGEVLIRMDSSEDW